LISVYITTDEFEKLEELAKHFGWPIGGTLGACIRNCWERVLAAKSHVPR